MEEFSKGVKQEILFYIIINQLRIDGTQNPKSNVDRGIANELL